MCLRSQDSVKVEFDLNSPTEESPPYLSCSPGDSDVFLQESAFGSFISSPGDPSNVFSLPSPLVGIKRSSSSRSCHLSSSSDSSSSPRQASVKRFFRRSVSLIVKSKSDLELTSLSSSDIGNGPFSVIKESLLHVYRNSTLPQQGLCRFQEKLAEFVFSGGGGSVERWWKGEILPEGTRMLAVRVASPKDGDHLSALLQTWQIFYKITLPLLEAMMAPLNSIKVRDDVLEVFRDTVLPYAGIPATLKSGADRLTKEHVWKLEQMLLILARLGPCRCKLDDEDIKDGEEEEADKQMNNSEPRTPQSPVITVTPTDSQPSQQDYGFAVFSHWERLTINEMLFLLMKKRGNFPSNIPAEMLEEILHLHHGGRHDQDLHYRRQVSKLELHEKTPSPGQWLTRYPSSVHTLEELLRSAASR